MIRHVLLLMALLSNATTVEAESTHTSADHPSYVIRAGDVLKIDVFGHPDISGLIRVPLNGRPTLPLIGELETVLGLSLLALRDELTRRYNDGFLVNALVTVMVHEMQPRYAFVLGQVRAQGAIELPAFSSVSALQAISLSGGFLPNADLLNARLVRQDPDQPEMKMSLRLPASDDPEALTADRVLQPDDLIIVPLLEGVVVVGKVRQPGAVALPSQGRLTVTKAIALAGGFEKFARGDRVQLLRDGSPTQVVDAEGLLSGKSRSTDPELEPGDTIFIPDAKF